jgi:urease accessory protein
MDDLALMRLLQLCSPTLPVGAYTYSQGLEWAVHAGAVSDEASAGRWIGELLELGIGRFEAPLLVALMGAWAASDGAEVVRLNADFLASRESAELRAETVQMGYSLRRLLGELREPAFEPLIAELAALPEIAFPTVWAGLAVASNIEPRAAVSAYLWAWAENQVLAALKSVPLGQAAGQRLLADLGRRIAPVAAAALQLPEAAWSNFMPAFAIASVCHESQYSRLFRS